MLLALILTLVNLTAEIPESKTSTEYSYLFRSSFHWAKKRLLAEVIIPLNQQAILTRQEIESANSRVSESLRWHKLHLSHEHPTIVETIAPLLMNHPTDRKSWVIISEAQNPHHILGLMAVTFSPHQLPSERFFSFELPRNLRLAPYPFLKPGTQSTLIEQPTMRGNMAEIEHLANPENIPQLFNIMIYLAESWGILSSDPLMRGAPDQYLLTTHRRLKAYYQRMRFSSLDLPLPPPHLAMVLSREAALQTISARIRQIPEFLTMDMDWRRDDRTMPSVELAKTWLKEHVHPHLRNCAIKVRLIIQPSFQSFP